MAMESFSGTTFAALLPRAQAILPQLGSQPWTAHLNSGELATDLAAISASRSDRAPRTATSTSFVAPSPSAATARASSMQTRASAPANLR